MSWKGPLKANWSNSPATTRDPYILDQVLRAPAGPAGQPGEKTPLGSKHETAVGSKRRQRSHSVSSSAARRQQAQGANRPRGCRGRAARVASPAARSSGRRQRAGRGWHHALRPMASSSGAQSAEQRDGRLSLPAPRAQPQRSAHAKRCSFLLLFVVFFPPLLFLSFLQKTTLFPYSALLRGSSGNPRTAPRPVPFQQRSRHVPPRPRGPSPWRPARRSD